MVYTETGQRCERGEGEGLVRRRKRGCGAGKAKRRGM